jgi:hypothetical protein
MRLQVQTQLNAENPMDERLLQECQKLKKEKKYTQTFRDAFRLILSLRNHDRSVLDELFPWVATEPPNREQLDQYFKPFVKKLMSDEFLGAEYD